MNKDTDSRGVGGVGGRESVEGGRVGDARVGIGGRLTGAGPRPGPPPVLRFDQHVPHPPGAVWRALTDPDLLALWWARGDVRPVVVGHRFTLDMGAWGVQPCEVTAVDPERLLEYHFAEGVLETTITWRLEPEDEGTRLYLVHAGFDLDSLQGRLAYSGMGNGWPHILNGIERALDAVSARS